MKATFDQVKDDLRKIYDTNDRLVSYCSMDTYDKIKKFFRGEP